MKTVYKKRLLYGLIFGSLFVGISGWSEENSIRLNTVGFLPKQEKRATFVSPAETFEVIHAASGKIGFKGTVSEFGKNEDTGETVYLADFTALTEEGEYYLNAPGAGRSPFFRIGTDIYNTPYSVVMRGMYLWRCGMAVSGEYQGQTFAHEACHTNDAYLDHAIGEHAKKDGTKGWHDAGDYNKYIVNAGVTVGMMFQAWEQFSPKIKSLSLDFPESTNALPDFLDEMKYEMDWVLTMQAEDGSVYHKLSTLAFGGFILPEQEKTPRFFTSWSSAATADFVAMTAMAARIFQPYDADYAQTCLNAARKSYAFLESHPDNHRADLQGFSTGAYQTNDPDDRLWAAAEMWESTGEEHYRVDFETRANAFTTKIDIDWDWGNVKNLGMFTYLLSKRDGKNPETLAAIRDALIASADSIVQTKGKHGYGRPLGTKYYWGCNGSVARQTMILQIANRFSENPQYITTALDALNHLFGRNYYGRSFVTGLGENPPMNPHDRRSGGDTIKDPWPGYLVGGGWPNGTSWVDQQESYQTNEIAINWNGALIYALAGFVNPPQPAEVSNP